LTKKVQREASYFEDGGEHKMKKVEGRKKAPGISTVGQRIGKLNQASSTRKDFIKMK